MNAATTLPTYAIGDPLAGHWLRPLLRKLFAASWNAAPPSRAAAEAVQEV